MTHKTLERQRRCLGGGQASHGVHEPTSYRRPPGVERREAPGKCSHILSDFLAAGWESIGSELRGSQRMVKCVAKFLKTTCPSGSLERVGLGDVQSQWTACNGAHPGHERSIFATRGNAVTQSFLVLRTNGGRRPKIQLFPHTGTARSKTGEADDTISLDSKRCLWMGPVFERLQRWRPQDKPLLNLNYAEYLVLFRRATANLQKDKVPYQGRHSGASVDRAENSQTLVSVQRRGRWSTRASKYGCVVPFTFLTPPNPCSDVRAIFFSKPFLVTRFGGGDVKSSHPQELIDII